MKRRKIGRYRWWFAFVRRDVWIGVYWKPEAPSSPPGWDPVMTVYVCLIPCLPLVIERY